MRYTNLCSLIMYMSAQFHGQCLEPYYIKNFQEEKCLHAWEVICRYILFQITKIKGRQFFFLAHTIIMESCMKKNAGGM